MIEAYKKFWKGYVDFEGRSTRSDYWFVVLANFLLIMALYLRWQGEISQVVYLILLLTSF